MAVLHSAPKYSSNEGLLEAIVGKIGSSLVEAAEAYGELTFTVVREDLASVMAMLREDEQYQQLMEIAGVDYPSRAERFEVCYHLLSLTKNHRIRVKVSTDEIRPVPSVTHIWEVAGWLEREVYDMYGVLFSGNKDLRRILTDYGFKGHPFRKDFPLSGHTEVRYSEEDGRVIYQPVDLAQDFRSFDYMSPWEGADYVLPGDEKAPLEPRIIRPGAPDENKAETRGAPGISTPKTTEHVDESGASPETNKSAEAKVSEGSPAQDDGNGGPPAPEETESRRDEDDKPGSEPGKGSGS